MKEKKEINVELGGRVQAAREAARFTQDKLGELVDLGTKNISAIERGVVGVSLSSFKRICQVLGVSSDTLLFGPAENNDMRDLVSRLERLSPEQFQIASDVFNKLLEAFALAEQGK